MALYWHWSNVLGELQLKNGKNKWRKRIYKGENCMAVLADYVYPEVKDGKGVGKPEWTVYGEFWNDATHFRKMMGLAKNYKGEYHNYYKDVAKVRLNTFFWDNEMLAIITGFVKNKVPVELYYKEIKKPKEKKRRKL